MRVFLLKTKADYYRYIAERKKALGTAREDNRELGLQNGWIHRNQL